MTPAINLVERKQLEYQVHQYAHDSDADSYGLDAVQKLGQDKNQVFKTLVLQIENGGFDNSGLVVAIVPVGEMLSTKLLAKSIGVKKVSMAQPLEVEKSTGYVLGGVRFGLNFYMSVHWGRKNR